MSLWFRPPASSTFGRVSLLAARTCLVAVALLTSACSKQGEGERCDLLSGSEDCDKGLICTPLAKLRNGAEGAVCCPSSNPSESICRSSSFGFDDDAGTSSAPDSNGATNTSDETASNGASSSTDGAAVDAGLDAAVSSSAPANTEPTTAPAQSSEPPVDTTQGSSSSQSTDTSETNAQSSSPAASSADPAPTSEPETTVVDAGP